MKVIVGLGNPGSEYEHTPHNIGFLALDKMASELGATWEKDAKFKGLTAKATYAGATLWLIKPQTYMNLSGECVQPFLKYYGASIADLLVLSDDCDIPAGTMRMRAKGSAGGHNGLKSIIQHLGSQDFARLRLGVGRGEKHEGQPNERKLVKHVIGRYSPEMEAIAEETAGEAVKATLCWTRYGTNEVMNRFNGWQAPLTQPKQAN